MPDEKLTKSQRQQAAREAARIAREKAERRARLLRWAVPSAVTLGVLAIGVVIALVVINSIPKPAFPGGPENMASDGILFTGENGEAVPVSTPAIAEDESPTPTEPQGEGVAHIVSYLDWSCPACKSFEAQYSSTLVEQVAAGEATLEVHPIAILDNAYAGSRYSSRAANVAACVAEYAPESFLDVQTQFFENQPQEGTPGLDDDEMLELVAAGGVDDERVTSCVEDESFRDWVSAATARAEVQGTPTVVVNGDTWDPNADGDFLAFVEAARA